jgi:hypothetical protein
MKACRPQPYTRTLLCRTLREDVSVSVDSMEYAELTGRATARILRERRIATVYLKPATGAIRTGVLCIGVRGATMLVHDAM